MGQLVDSIQLGELGSYWYPLLITSSGAAKEPAVHRRKMKLKGVHNQSSSTSSTSNSQFRGTLQGSVLRSTVSCRGTYWPGWIGLRSTPVTMVAGFSCASRGWRQHGIAGSVKTADVPNSMAQMPVPVPTSRTRPVPIGDKQSFPPIILLRSWCSRSDSQYYFHTSSSTWGILSLSCSRYGELAGKKWLCQGGVPHRRLESNTL